MSKQFQFKLVLLGMYFISKEPMNYWRIPSAQANQPSESQGEWCTVALSAPQLSDCSLVLRFVKDQFDDYRESTIGGEYSRSFPLCIVLIGAPFIAAFLTQTVTLEDQTTVKFEIW